MRHDETETRVTWQCDCCGAVLGSEVFRGGEIADLPKPEFKRFSERETVVPYKPVRFASDVLLLCCDTCARVLATVACPPPQRKEIPF